MAFTSITGAVGAVGQRWKAAIWNLVIQAIQELQAGMFGTPFLHVTNSAAVTNGSVYPYNTVVSDTASGWNTSTKIYTVAQAGQYMAVVAIQPNAAVGVAPNLYVNGSIRIAAGYLTNIASGSGALVGVVTLAAGDLVKVQEAGNNYTPANASTNYFQLKFLSPT